MNSVIEQKLRKRSRGFTLLEMTMVILIFGMISSVLFTALKLYHMQEVKTNTDESLKISENAITEFRNLHKRYPCPADPSLGPGDANYGFEAQPCDPGVPYLLQAPGARDTLADDEIPPLPDPILIGAVPFNTMILGPDRIPNTFDEIRYTDMTDRLSSDGWNRKLTYAVTRSQVNPGTFNEFNGAIAVVDENDLDVLGEPNTAHLVLVSHGENGRGAFMADGAAVDPCPVAMPIPPPIPPVTVTISEIENCNNIGKFLNGLKIEADHSYNDDLIRIVVNQSSDLWIPTGANSINNTNVGFVGVGTPDPQQQLHIQGNLTVNQELLALQYCDVVGDLNSCIPGNLFADTYDEDTNGVQDMRCPAGQIATGIDDNKLRCVNAFAGGVNMTCPAGRYVIGISNTRGALCCNPLLPSANPHSCAGFIP